MKEKDILFELGKHFVIAVGSKGYEVLAISASGTHSVRVASIGRGPGPQLGLDRAIAECKKREGVAS